MAVCHGLSELQYFSVGSTDEILQMLKVTQDVYVSVCRVNSVIGIGVGAGAYILSRFAVSSDIFQLLISLSFYCLKTMSVPFPLSHSFFLSL